MKKITFGEVLKAKDTSEIVLDDLRQQVGTLAQADERFNKKPEGQSNNCWPSQPWIDGIVLKDGDFSAVICAVDGRLWKVGFDILKGQAANLAETALEVKTKKQYVAASEQFKFNGEVVQAKDEKKEEDFYSEGVAFCKDSGAIIPTEKKWEFGKATDFQWMPGGTHIITCGCNGRSVRLAINSDETGAKAVQSSFERAVAATPRRLPFGCIEHEEKAKAFEPVKFGWKNEPEPGIYCTAKPTKLGEENVNGKLHTSFSPCFRHDAKLAKSKCEECQKDYAACSGTNCDGVLFFEEGMRGSESNPAKVIGVFEKSVGSLTNWPAFKDILPTTAEEPATAAEKAAAKKKPTAKGEAISAYEHRMMADIHPGEASEHAKKCSECAENASKACASCEKEDKHEGHAYAASAHDNASTANRRGGNWQMESHHQSQAEMHRRYSKAALDEKHPEHSRAMNFKAGENSKPSLETIYARHLGDPKAKPTIEQLYTRMGMNGQPATR